jgi:hypothetical protein
MRATAISCAVLAALGVSESRALDWEVNLESNINPSTTVTGPDQNGYRWDLYRDASRGRFADTPDLLKAEATFRPSGVGAIDWEIGVGATVRPGNRMDTFDQRRGHGNLGDLNGALTIRATIRPRSSRSLR